MHAVRIAVVALASVYLASAAHAQPAAPPPAEKSVTTGIALALVGSALPPAMLALGKSVDDDSQFVEPLYIGGLVGAFALPSMGVFYSEPSMAGMRRSPLYGIGPGIRAIAIGAFILDEIDDKADILEVAIGIYAVGCLIDVAVTPHAVGNANAQRARQGTRFAVAPAAFRHGGGLVLGGMF